jgi:hypothetical protein
MFEASVSTYLATYLAGGFALLAWMAFLDRHWLREAFWLSILWPVTLLVIVPSVLLLDWLELRGWFVDVMYQADLSPFGFRTRADDGTGWAIRCLRLELQVWKHKKEPRP